MSDTPWIVCGERVGLLPPERDSFIERWKIYNDPVIGMYTCWPAFGGGGPSLPPFLREQREEIYRSLVAHETIEFDICLTSDRRCVGEIYLTNFQPGQNCAEVVMAILREEDRGCGYGTEAMLLLADYAFDACGLRKIVMRFLATNPAAVQGVQRSASAVGAHVVGVERQAVWAFGDYRDAVHVELLAAEIKRTDFTAKLRRPPDEESAIML
jgi:RimJ/RimL family protein N-acetyltransferase